jgi:flagellar motor protein MotB
MKAVWRKGTLLGVLATAALTVGCAGKGVRELEEQNRTLQSACDDLRRRNENLEKENAAYKGERPIRDAYVDMLEKQAALARRIQELLDQSKEELLGMKRTPKGWELEGDFFFRSGSDDVSKEGVESLKKLGNVLTSQGVFLRIVGHTDNDPIHRSLKENPTGMNLQLGARRAVSVAHILKEAGVEETKMQVVSLGEATPKVPNDSRENKKQNRRVEIQVSPMAPEGYEASVDKGEKAPAPSHKAPTPKKVKEEPTK